MTSQTRIYPLARIINVHDGDTIRLDVDLGFSTHAYVWIRLTGVRAPELRDPGGNEARQVVVDWLIAHAPDGYVTVTTQQVAGEMQEIREKMTFIRYVGWIDSQEDIALSLNDYLREQGYTDQGM